MKPSLSYLTQKASILLLGAAVSVSWVNSCSAGQEAQVETAGPTVVAPSSLTERERQSLDQQYRYQVRNKSALLGAPAVSTPYPAAAAGYGPLQPQETDTSEEAKFNRYFSAAKDLYRNGQFEESAEILRYLHETYPDDDHVKSYLVKAEKEARSQKTRWKRDTHDEAYKLKRTKLKGLVRDGIDYYNNRDFDKSLLKFSDALSLDPENRTAKRYMDMLKKHYSKELQVERIAQNWSGQMPDEDADLDPQVVREADKLLDKTSGGKEKPADNILNEAELKNFVSDKRAEDLLEQVEFGSRIDSIIAAQKMREARADQLTFGAGDVVNIAVLGHPELSGNVIIRPDGAAVLPLTNDSIAAGGLTVDEFAEKATKTLEKYIQNPYATVSVVSQKSQIFYVIDEVSCTPYPITKANLTLLDALFLSDWGNNRALGRVIVIKPSKIHPVIKKVDAFDMIYRGNLKDNIRIASGDVIYVPMTIAAKTTKVIYDTLAPFNAAMQARDDYLGLKWNKQDYFNFFRMPETPEDMSPSANTGNSGGANINISSY